MPPLLNLSELYNNYRNWINKNPQVATDFEITTKWVSYFIAGRINNSHIVSELVYCLSNLLVLHNDRVISNLRQIYDCKTGERLKLFLTIIEYSEVFLELSAAKLWGEKGRWLIISIIQIFKCISKLILVHHYKESIIQDPVIPVLERRKLGANIIGKTNNLLDSTFDSLGSMSFKLKRSGRVIRKVEASPPVNLRSWKPMESEMSGNFENEENIEQALIERQLAAETLYLIKPLAHLGSIAYFGNNNWKPYILALMFDLCSLQLYRSCKNTKYNSLDIKQKLQISRRTFNLLLYLIRSPFYDKYSRQKINNFLNSLSRVPLASLICTPLIQYLPFWQSNYFYMWSS